MVPRFECIDCVFELGIYQRLDVLPDLMTALLVKAAYVKGFSNYHYDLFVCLLIVQQTQEQTADLADRNQSGIVDFKGSLDALEYLDQEVEQVLLELVVIVQVVLAGQQPRVFIDLVE